MRVLRIRMVGMVIGAPGRQRLFVQRLQHAALRHGGGRGAPLPDRLDLALELGQLGDAGFDMAQVLVEQTVDFLARRLGLACSSISRRISACAMSSDRHLAMKASCSACSGV